MELWRELSRHASVNTIEHERVKVQLEIERTPESRHEPDRSLARTRDALLASQTLENTVHTAHDDSPHATANCWVKGGHQVNPVGERNHALRNQDIRHHIIDPMCSAAGHASAAPQGSEAAALARGKPPLHGLKPEH